MDRDRETLQSEFNKIMNLCETCNDSRYPKERDKLIMEILLDIREELRQVKKTQGSSKWGSKLR